MSLVVTWWWNGCDTTLPVYLSLPPIGSVHVLVDVIIILDGPNWHAQVPEGAGRAGDTQDDQARSPVYLSWRQQERVLDVNERE